MSDAGQVNGRETVGVTINGREVRAEKDRLLIDVAEEIGVFVPRFCYHPGMKSVAVCRMCLVQVEGQGKLLPACATPVADGMVVNTKDGAAEAQKDMLELLLINHPLDCPICDRAGECPLQDQTYAHGPGSSRYTDEKRTFEKALEISDLVVLDRERCVLCWRCVRFSDEIAGDRFIQLVDRGDGTQILNFNDEPFDSYFSGNTIQICPVGALTSKPYRFVSRPWDLQTAPSVCGYCSVGCPITNESREGDLVRCQALPNEKVNDFWICDKGRFGYHYVSSEERLDTPLVRGDADAFEQTSWAEAVAKVADGLRDKKVGVIAGGHLTTEDAYAVGRLAKEVLGTRDVDSRIQDVGAPYEAILAATGVAGSSATMDDLRAAKNVVWVGPDPKETLPVLYLHLQTGARERGTKLLVASPRSTSLDLIASQAVRLQPGKESAALGDLGDQLGDGDTVVCWGPSSPGRDESATVDAVLALAEKAGAKLLVCPPHAGSQGMLDMGVHPAIDAGHIAAEEPGRDTRAILEAATSGELDALVIVGADPVVDFPDAGLAKRALGSDVFTVVVELFPTETALLADVLLPSAAYAERKGTFTNLERRLQKFEPLLSAPGTAQTPWRACAAIAMALGQDWGWKRFADVWVDIRANVATHKDVDPDTLTQEAPPAQAFDTSGYAREADFRPLQIAGPGGQYPKGHRSGAPFQTGQNWPLSWELRAFEARQRPGLIPSVPSDTDRSDTATPSSRSSEGSPSASPPAEASSGASGSSLQGGFRLLSGRFIYDEGSMVSRSRALQALQRKPFVEINDEDAKALGISDGDEVVVSGADNEMTLPARVIGIAKGCVFVPYDQVGLRANSLMEGVDPSVEVRKA